MFPPFASSFRACAVPRRNALRRPRPHHRRQAFEKALRVEGPFVSAPGTSSLLQYLFFILLHAPLERGILPDLVLCKSPELCLFVVALRGRDILQRLAPLLTELLRPRNRRREHETSLRRIHQKMIDLQPFPLIRLRPPYSPSSFQRWCLRLPIYRKPRVFTQTIVQKCNFLQTICKTLQGGLHILTAVLRA